MLLSWSIFCKLGIAFATKMKADKKYSRLEKQYL